MKINKIATGAYISSSPVITLIDGRLSLIWGGDGVRMIDLTDPHRMDRPGWPQKGTKFFASSPAIHDVDNDGEVEVFCGNDDHLLYGWRQDGSQLPGFPVVTGGDVYSSPALADLTGNGQKDIIFGSDDGKVYAVDCHGQHLPGWPRQTGHFVSASPTVCDLDGDGNPEIIIGSWDKQLYVWKADGQSVPGFPVKLGHIIWANAAVADLDGCGSPEIIISADQLYVFRRDGSRQPGFPVRFRSWTKSTPCIADTRGDGHLEIGVGSDRFYVFRSNGTLAPGFPVDLGGYIWSSPICVDIDGCGYPEWIVADWNGKVHVIRHTGERLSELTLTTGNAIYSSPAFYQTDKTGLLAVGSWDTNMYLLAFSDTRACRVEKSAFRGDALRCGQWVTTPGKPLPIQKSTPEPPQTIKTIQPVCILPDPPEPNEIIYLDMVVDPPEAVAAAMIYYEVNGSQHPSPMVYHQNRLRGMIHPLRPGSICTWYIEITDFNGNTYRIPSDDEEKGCLIIA